MLTDNVGKNTKGTQLFARQQFQHTIGHVNCPACERSNTEALYVITAETSFTKAALGWLDFLTLPTNFGSTDGRYIKANTEESYRQYCTSLDLFFGEMPIGKIHYGNLREYQRARLDGAEPFIRYRRPQDAREKKVGKLSIPAKGKTPCPVKPKKINQELGILRRIMIDAAVWTPELEKKYRPLLEEEDEVQRALEPEEQELWLHTAASRESWELVHWYSQLGIGQTLGTNELRFLRVGDVNLYHRTVSVKAKGVKGKGRNRSIALLTAEDLWAAEKLLERAKERGASAPQHYVFPFRTRRNTFDPTQPMSTSGIKREWQEVREASGLLWFRPYDLRHTGGTRLAEQGWRAAQIKARMGHITDKMNEHYTHITEGAQRREYERVNTLKFAPRAVGRERSERFERRVVS